MATDATTTMPVVKLSDLQDGQDVETFAVLLKRVRGTTYKGDSFLKCFFRDKRTTLEAPVWADSRFRQQAESWREGTAFRLRVRTTLKPKYGLQLEIVNIREAVDADAEDGYDFADLVESSEQNPDDLFRKIVAMVEKSVEEEPLKRLVLDILTENADLFKKMPAAQNFHHSFTGGLIEHVWSMTRIACMLADHYDRYYHGLNPRLNKGVVVAATVLHDIGKLHELKYDPVEAKYTTPGCLIGHILMGRDMVRDAARKIDGFPDETLLMLEHAILAHHGKREFGAPILPQTMEAMLVSYIDEMDAKMNAAARGLLRCTGDDPFTDKVFVLDNRRLYKGIPLPAEPDDDAPDLP